MLHRALRQSRTAENDFTMTDNGGVSVDGIFEFKSDDSVNTINFDKPITIQGVQVDTEGLSSDLSQLESNMIDVSGRVYTNEGNIITNTSDIASNTSNISTNTTNIATNTSNISTNTSDIASNTSSIGTNTTNIASNTSSIGTNTSNIATNTTNIASNTSNISTNTTNIASNTSSIGTNTTNIASNTSSIGTNTTNIASNTSSIGTNTSNISTNTTNIASNTSSIGTNTSDIASNTSSIGTNTTNIATNTTNIATNTTNIATNTTNIASNTSNISTNTTNIASNTSSIGTNTTNIASNTSSIGTNTTNIASNTSNISTNTSDIASNTSNISTNTSDIATNTSNISTNATNITQKVSKSGDQMSGTLGVVSGSDYASLTYYGMEINRTTQYVRPYNNSTDTLHVGYSSKQYVGINNWVSSEFKVYVGLDDKLIIDSTNCKIEQPLIVNDNITIKDTTAGVLSFKDDTLTTTYGYLSGTANDFQIGKGSNLLTFKDNENLYFTNYEGGYSSTYSQMRFYDDTATSFDDHLNTFEIRQATSSSNTTLGTMTLQGDNLTFNRASGITTYQPIIKWQNAGTNKWYLGTTGGSSDNLMIYGVGSNDFTIYTNASPRLTVNSSGNVELTGKLLAQDQIRATENVDGDDIDNCQILAVGDRFTGMGIYSTRTSGYLGGYQFFNYNDIRVSEITSDVNGELKFWTATSPSSPSTLQNAMTITTGKKVGINTSSPNAYLHVNGNIKCGSGGLSITEGTSTLSLRDYYIEFNRNSSNYLMPPTRTTTHSSSLNIGYYTGYRYWTAITNFTPYFRISGRSDEGDGYITHSFTATNTSNYTFTCDVADTGVVMDTNSSSRGFHFKKWLDVDGYYNSSGASGRWTDYSTLPIAGNISTTSITILTVTFDVPTSPNLNITDQVYTNSTGMYVSLETQYGIYVGTGIMYSSDKRIKKNIEDLSDNECLDIIRKIQPKKYEYKDQKRNSSGKTYGFIAQEVKEVLPDAVNLIRGRIPFIDKSSYVVGTHNTSQKHGYIAVDITHIKDELDTLQIGEELYYSVLYDNDKSGDITTQDQEYQYTDKWEGYESITDADGNIKYITKLKHTPKWETIDEKNVELKPLIATITHKWVDDFHKVKKDVIWTCGISAIQENDRRITALENKHDTNLVVENQNDLVSIIEQQGKMINQMKEQMKVLQQRINYLELNI